MNLSVVATLHPFQERPFRNVQPESGERVAKFRDHKRISLNNPLELHIRSLPRATLGKAGAVEKRQQ